MFREDAGDAMVGVIEASQKAKSVENGKFLDCVLIVRSACLYILSSPVFSGSLQMSLTPCYPTSPPPPLSLYLSLSLSLSLSLFLPLSLYPIPLSIPLPCDIFSSIAIPIHLTALKILITVVFSRICSRFPEIVPHRFMSILWGIIQKQIFRLFSP